MTRTSLRRSSLAGHVLRWRVLVLATLAASSAAHAASIFEFDRWMQRIDKRALSLQKSLQRQDAAASAADAAELEELYRLMQGYFEQEGNAARAVDLSRQGRAAAAAIVEQVADADFAAANDAVRSITRECRTCHRAYKPL